MQNLHNDFIEQIREMGIDADALIRALDTDPSVAIRPNLQKGFAATTDADPVLWCRHASYLASRPAFTFDPFFHSGAYYVQDPSSMIIDRVVRHLTEDRRPVNYLDLCAAPGGKTTAAIDALPEGSLVVANEIDRSRAFILRQNVIKWGVDCCVVTNDTPKRIGSLRNFFDIIAADMPCSGEGMFRKDSQAVAQWSKSLVRQCSQLSRQIVADVWDALRPGGYFILSTCTFNRDENEEIVRLLVDDYDAEPVAIPCEHDWGIAPAIDSAAPAMRFLPHLIRGEGLFMAVVRKPGNGSRYTPKSGRSRKTSQKVPPMCENLLVGSHILSSDGTVITALPDDRADAMRYVADSLNAIYCGIEPASIKGKDIIPSQALALSRYLNRNNIATVDVDYPEAISYLRGEPITVDAPKGYVLVEFEGAPLGWLKNLGNRTNNLYPKEWRIRSTHTPEQPTRVVIGKRL